MTGPQPQDGEPLRIDPQVLMDAAERQMQDAIDFFESEDARTMFGDDMAEEILTIGRADLDRARAARASGDTGAAGE